MAENDEFVPAPREELDLRAFLPQPGLAEQLGRGPWVVAGTGAGLIALGALGELIGGSLTSASNPMDAVTVMIIVGVLLVGLSVTMVGTRLISRVRHQRSIPYPANLPEEDRPRLQQLAIEYAGFHDQLEAVADPGARKAISQSLTVPISGRPFFLPGRLRRQALEPGEDSVRIVTSRAWHDRWLTDHRLDIDPLTEATEIYRYLHQLTSKANDLLDKAEVHRGTPSERTYRQYIADLTGDLSAVRGRADALAGYDDQIERLSVLLRSEDLLPQIETDGDAVRDLIAESRRHELATEHLDRQRQELQQIASGLREIRSLLAGDRNLQLP